jgi:hypothetical protein
MLFYLTLTAIFLLSNACLIYQVDYEQIENIFENQINNLNISIMCLGYNLVYCYSLAQIKYNKIKNVVNTLSNTIINTLINSSKITILKKEKIYIITTYKDGTKVNELMLNSNDSSYITSWKLENKDTFDLIIVSDKKDESGQINYIHYTEFPQILDDYKHSTIKFFSVELEYKDTIHSIELTNENYNHYIVNNVLNKHFFKYYLTNVLNIEIDKNTFDYNLSVIDHNVNIVELTQNDSLIIKENNYELIIDLTESDELFKESDELFKERSVSDDYVKFE